MTRLFEIGLYNALAAGILSMVVFVVLWRWRNEKIAYLLWLAVLVRFVAPPIFDIPLSIPQLQAISAKSITEVESPPQPITPKIDNIREEDRPDVDVKEHSVNPAAIASEMPLQSEKQNIFGRVWQAPSLVTVLMFLWCAGSVFLLGTFIVNLALFRRLVLHSTAAPANLCMLARCESEKMGLRACPEIRLINAEISPLIWSVWGRPFVLIPSALSKTLCERQLRLILAHEFAHLRRRDHWGRWLEITVVVLHWWNPLLWWVRSQWRLAAEMCCDAAVLNTYREQTYSYAEALVATVEFISAPRRSIPAIALNFGRKTHLKTRVETMLKHGYGNGISRRSRLILIVCGLLILLPLLAVGFRASVTGDEVTTDKTTRTESERTGIESDVVEEAQAVNVDVPSRWIRSVAFSPDGRLLAGGSADGIIRLWEAKNGKSDHEKFQGHEHTIHAIRFSKDGETLQTLGTDHPGSNFVKTWNVETGELLKATKLELLPPKTWLDASTFSPNGTSLAGQFNFKQPSFYLWNTLTGKSIKKLDVTETALSTAFSPDGSLLAVGTISLRPEDGSSRGGVQIFDTETGQRLRTIDLHPRSISAITFSPDGQVLAGGDHRAVRVWDVKTGKLLRELRGHSGVIEAITFSPDGLRIAAGGQGPGLRSPREWRVLSELKVWEWQSGKLLRSMAGQPGRTVSIAFSPDGGELAWSDFASITWEQFKGGRSWTIYLDR